MKTIAVVGDSHTWGEGVGAERVFVPPVCGGDLRAVSFAYPTYVNLLREALNAATGSSCEEYEGERLWALCEGREGPCGVVSQKPLIIESAYTLARVFFLAEAEGAEAMMTAAATATITFGDKTGTVSVPLQSDTDALNACIRVAHIRVPTDGIAQGLLLARNGGRRILVQRVELYRGDCALINCGIGSCPTGRYVDRYFDRYIAPLSPHAILYEGNTINDWLQSPTPEAYAANLRRMLEAQRGLTSRILWHTVTPIYGDQINGQGIAYDDYVHAMRRAAAAAHVTLADCNAEMNTILKALPEAERAPYFFADPWHPNGTGHRLYAEMICPALMSLL